MRTSKTILVILIFTISSASCFSEGWRNMLATITFDVAVNPRNHNTIFVGGYERLLYRSYDGGRTWDTIPIGFRWGQARFNNVIIHPVDTNTVIIGGLNYGELSRTTDGGNTFENVYPGISPLSLNGKSLMFKPDNPDIIYAGDYWPSIIYRSTNKGETWDSISTVRETIKIKDPDGNLKDTIVPVRLASTGIRDDSTNILLAGSTRGRMFISTDNGITWKYTDNLLKPRYFSDEDCEITRITFIEGKPLVGYACVTYLFPLDTPNGGLYRTSDGGYNWHRIAFPDTSLWAVSAREFNGNEEVFAGGYTDYLGATEKGWVPGCGIVRRSQDGGKTWYTFDHLMDWTIVPTDLKNNSAFSSVFFVRDTGFIVGSNGRISRTTSMGESWNEVPYQSYDYLKSVCFLTGKKGFISDGSGNILYTTNMGNNWQKIYRHPSNKSLNSISFINQSTGLVAGNDGIIMKTLDTGKTWTSKTSPVNHNLKYINILNSLVCFIIGENGTILKSLDGGENWSSQNSGTTENLNSSSFFSQDSGYIVGNKGTLLFTSNGGSNWNKITSGTGYDLTGIDFPSKDKGYICGDSGSVFIIDNLTVDWKSIVDTTKRPLYGIKFFNPDTGIIFGKHGTLLATFDGGKLWETRYWGWGPAAKMWSLRYFGDKGKEKVYMASEAGCFVRDYPAIVIDEKLNIRNSNLNVIAIDSRSLNITYKPFSNHTDTRLMFRIISLSGQSVYEQSIASAAPEINFSIFLPGLASGVYLCQMIEDGKITTERIIIEK